MQETLLLRLRRLNRTAVFFGTLAILLGALLLPVPLSGLALLILAAALLAIMSATWRIQPTGTRVLRASVLVLLVAVALTRLS